VTESELQTIILKYLKTLGYFRKVMVANNSGTPDIVGCIGGRFIAIEVKAKTGKVTELQKHNIKLIQDSGGLALIAYSLNDVIEFLDLHCLL
jgi:Holliday junction resolvase